MLLNKFDSLFVAGTLLGSSVDVFGDALQDLLRGVWEVFGGKNVLHNHCKTSTEPIQPFFKHQACLRSCSDIAPISKDPSMCRIRQAAKTL